MRTFRAYFARRGTLAVAGGGQLLYEGCSRSSSSGLADYSQPASFDRTKWVENRSTGQRHAVADAAWRFTLNAKSATPL